MQKRRKRHSAEQIVKKLRDADVMLNGGKSVEEVECILQTDPRVMRVYRSRFRAKETFDDEETTKTPYAGADSFEAS